MPHWHNQNCGGLDVCTNWGVFAFGASAKEESGPDRWLRRDWAGNRPGLGGTRTCPAGSRCPAAPAVPAVGRAAAPWAASAATARAVAPAATPGPAGRTAPAGAAGAAGGRGVGRAGNGRLADRVSSGRRATGIVGQNPQPFVGTPPFRPPTFNPVDGALVGVAKPIIINFEVPIANRAMAEQAIHISSSPPVPGRFYWTTDSQLRWRPQDFWPAETTVTIDAAGTVSSFRVGDSLVATIDDDTLEMEVMKNGELVKTFPVSMGKKGKETKNGTYYVLEKFDEIVMDSSTYGVPVDSPDGYKLEVEDAVRIDNTGNFVHSAPWSVGSQGSTNVSHGCINLAPSNAQWFFDNFGSGDPIVIKNSVGWYTQPDGAEDWQLF